ncbi:hypothetical protein Cantr_07344 [Candida viswanathii]|uniref:Uncharacterized protein n=1 Tax=Candida viswanathii TaxID=5486 RepID=A0A367Y3M4_9ASCO|nr:hypothetical protein Cantr_07344 [Candida viswanathii]
MSTIETNHESTPTVTASLIPMSVQYSGPAKTDDYFTPSKMQEPQPNGPPLDVAYFRGCKLVGKTIDLKESNLQGYVVNKSEHLVRDEASGDVKTAATFTPLAKFNDLTVYGHDTPVALNDHGC